MSSDSAVHESPRVMQLSVFDLFKVGIGPSSSHTVGPMRAARRFALTLRQKKLLAQTSRVISQLYGSLGATGKGHGSDTAVMLGLAGHEPDTIDVECIPALLKEMRSGCMSLVGEKAISFNDVKDVQLFGRQSLPFHANGMRFIAEDAEGAVLLDRIYYSVGGGFIVEDGDGDASPEPGSTLPRVPLAYPFTSGNELLRMAKDARISIAEVMRCNERHWRRDEETRAGLLHIWKVMQDCVHRGCRTEGFLPGPFKVKRRAAQFHRALTTQSTAASADPLQVMDWVNLYALAVNEENAAGGRVVTAPTNGAAGIVPAVLHYYSRFVHHANDEGVIDFLLTAAAIGILYKENASISGAEVGCQGEVGVACSMAAAALCQVMGGTPEQVENAAEIGMEHHLGLTCDPVGGLVQIPCIERNAIASVKAINAARMALRGDGTHVVSLDKVIKTMRDTGADMMTKYKETARGGLAVNIVEC